MEDIIFYFCMLHSGNWLKIYRSIERKEKIDDELLAEFKAKNKTAYITLLSDYYPEELKHCVNPPYILFYRGDLSLLRNEKKLAIVGTRNPSPYGVQMTKILTGELVDSDYTIVSGLAKGIDAYAHKEALYYKGKTIAIVANGLDVRYPHSNSPLYDQIIENGLLLSEYPDGVEPTKDKFYLRNRLIAALSVGTVVTEAFKNSGTLITIRHALEMNKEIFCVPTHAGENSVCNQMIKQGAKLTETAQDILDELN